MRLRSKWGRVPTARESSRAAGAGGDGQPRAVLPSARGVHGATTSGRARAQPELPPVPELFEVVTYFLARGDSYAMIAQIGFRHPDGTSKALTAHGLKLWYEAELERRAAELSR